MSIWDNCPSTVAINIDGSEHVALVTWQNIEKDTVCMTLQSELWAPWTPTHHWDRFGAWLNLSQTPNASRKCHNEKKSKHSARSALAWNTNWPKTLAEQAKLTSMAIVRQEIFSWDFIFSFSFVAKMAHHRCRSRLALLASLAAVLMAVAPSGPHWSLWKVVITSHHQDQRRLHFSTRYCSMWVVDGYGMLWLSAGPNLIS